MKSHTAGEKAAAVRRVKAEVAKGNSVNRACQIVGVSRSNHDRWALQFRFEGPGGLKPRYANCGRKPKARAGK